MRIYLLKMILNTFIGIIIEKNASLFKNQLFTNILAIDIMTQGRHNRETRQKLSIY